MKLNAPEKIYLYPDDRAGYEYEAEWGDKPWGEDYVEYTRTDAFIEKAATWFANRYQVNGYLDADDIDDFKNYMKGE